MKTLVVYYSRTGYTKKVAEGLTKLLDCDSEEIFDMIDRKGIIGYIRAGRDSIKKNSTKIKKIKHDPTEYDLVLVGGPIWGWNIAPALRAYLINNKNKIKKLGYFYTGGNYCPKTIPIVEEVSGIKTIGTLELKMLDVKKDLHENKLKEFVKKIQK